MLDEIVTGTYPPTSDSVVALVDLIFNRRDKICLPATKLSVKLNVTRIESTVIGGNSQTVELSARTLWEANAKGRILFLEEVGERGDHIEKRLDYFTQIGMFDGVVAVIFGNFEDSDDDWLIDFVLYRFARSVTFPVFRVTGIGHGKINYPLPFLTDCHIESIDGGVTYEFCVDNVQNTGNGGRKGANLTSKFSFLTVVVMYACNKW